MNKEPWLSICLSLLFPGLGQLYSGEKLRGLIIAFLGAVNLTFYFYSTHRLITLPDGIMVGSIIGIFFFWWWNIWDAYRQAKEKNSATFEQYRKQYADPWRCALFSLFLPGLGQWSLGNIPLGAILIIAYLASQNISEHTLKFSLGWNLSLFVILLRILTVAMAYQTSPPQRKPNPNQLKFWLGLGSISLITFIAVNGNLFYLARVTTIDWKVTYISTSIANPTIKNSDRFYPESSWSNFKRQRTWKTPLVAGGMSPTLKEKEILSVDRTAYWFRAPERNQIVVFNPPPALKQRGIQDYQTQRIIGLPQETVQIRAGSLFINDEPRVESNVTPDTSYNYGPVTVPKNQYVVLGDNRAKSFDSHEWGMLDQSFILGKVLGDDS